MSIFSYNSFDARKIQSYSLENHYPHDYRRSSYYKQSSLFEIITINLKIYSLKYMIHKTENIINLETNEPIF